MADPTLNDVLLRLDRVLAELLEVRSALAPHLTPAPAAEGNGLDTGEATLVRLRAAAVELGARISGDDRVAEATAARLLGIEPETLGKQRQEGRAPPNYKMPVGSSRISYKLADLARWVEERREDF